jgi:hypothetical protein
MAKKAKQKTVEFTEKEVQFGHTVYIILMVCILGVIAGIAWTIVDLILPQGLYEVFFHDNLGLQILVIGIAAFILFFLLILFYTFGKKGTRLITRAIFSAKRTYEGMNVSKLARFTTWGLIVSIGIFVVGVVWFIVEVLSSVSSGTSSGVDSAFVNFFINPNNGGLKFLVLALIATGVVLLFIFVSWLVNDGSIFFARAFLKIPVSMPKDTPATSASSDESQDAIDAPEE